MTTSPVTSTSGAAASIKGVPQRPPRTLWPVYVALVVLLSAYLGLNHLLEQRGNPGFAAWKPFVSETSSVLIMAVLLPFVIRLENRFRLDSRPRGRVVLAPSRSRLFMLP